MPSEKSFGNRLGFKRTNTSGDPVTVTELSAFDKELAPAPEAGPAGHSSSVVDGNAIIAEDVGRMSEVEATRRLVDFRRVNQWVCHTKPISPRKTVVKASTGRW